MSTLWGIGTTLYGKSDSINTERFGETYIATKWICIAYMPIIPIRSMRIGGVNERSLVLIVYNSTTKNYYILEDNLPFRWKQIIRTFVLAWGLLLGFLLLAYYISRIK
jgi:hypothetical protein